MPNIVDIRYNQTGESKSTNELGMREMQERAYAARNNQYLLLKAPPASGKSRALMFIGLDKLHYQGLEKVIVTVPERSIAGSFAPTELTSHGFFADWNPKPENNLCTPGSDQGKVTAFLDFMENDEEDILICTHATLRFAFDAINEEKFSHTLLAIDEIHHVSADSGNRLGEVLRGVIDQSDAHIVAMTGSYFRGDSVPVLLPEHERKFTKVTYTYYEQLNGYDYLQSLGIGYHFYQGRYTSAINDVLDPDKKTIIHIPYVQSGESTKDKHNEVDTILDSLGTIQEQDSETGVIYLERHDTGEILKIADLVYDLPRERDKIMGYLREINSPEDIDIIIALGMAKEGFDWPYCEHALTVGYRGSLTEIVQIIGRCTRDSKNKAHAQFTNLIAQPDAEDDEVTFSVNNMLKAITASLLMEQVLAPNFKFKRKMPGDDNPEPGEIFIEGFKAPSSQRVNDIIESDINDLKASILQDREIEKAIPGNVDPEVINKVMIPKIIQTKYPDLNEDEVEELRQHVVADSVLKKSEINESGDKRFIRMADQFINIEDLHIDLIDRINPFQQAFEVLSKSVNKNILKQIQDAIAATRIKMTQDEAIMLWPKIKHFVQENGREPTMDAADPLEQRMAQALIYLREQKRNQMANE